MLKIGVTGYSAQSFDKEQAKRLIQVAFDEVREKHGEPYETTQVVSGLTDLGIPSIAYREAVRRGWETVGIACKKATDYECFPVDELQIFGENWGDESGLFLGSINVLIRVGVGKQAIAETAKAKEMGLPVFEYELEAIK